MAPPDSSVSVSVTMAEPQSDATQGPDARAGLLVAAYERAGYRRAQPAILQPAEAFLDFVNASPTRTEHFLF